MRVKVCGIRNENELETAIRAGADAVGFLVGQRYASESFILPETAARLASLIPPFITPVLVTHLTEPEEIIELIDMTMITTIQLHGGSTPEQLPLLKEYLGNTGRLIVAQHIGDLPDEKVPDVSAFNEYADAFLLDSQDLQAKKVGGTGKTHNWLISAEFVNKTEKPVILAGGLNPENVADAIRTVHPFAVDANTALRPFGELDLKICEAFVQNARNAVVSGSEN